MKLAIIGLGYVGLPLARLFATKFPVVGFDIHTARVEALRAGRDTTLEVSEKALSAVLRDPLQNGGSGLWLSSDPESISGADVFIITVPTPVDRNNRPDLNPLLKASETVGKQLGKGAIVVYESTVFPGATEEVCVPVLEQFSGLKFNVDFFAGYSPERINPGDKQHTIEKILKITSGSTPQTAEIIDTLYRKVIDAGTYKASSIKVAEAAKVIENAQRDINIAFVNELAKIFNILQIDTREVLEAAATKWNFLPFKPGLVGGHCIGVDPYYLAQKAQEAGYHPEIILAGRRLNDSMAEYVASQIVKLMIRKNIPVNGAKALVLGITFKENCPDVRNTKIVDLVAHLESYGIEVAVYDPWANPREVLQTYGFALLENLQGAKYDTIIAAVAHREFEALDLQQFKKTPGLLYDIKGSLKQPVDGKL